MYCVWIQWNACGYPRPRCTLNVEKNEWYHGTFKFDRMKVGIHRHRTLFESISTLTDTKLREMREICRCERIVLTETPREFFLFSQLGKTAPKKRKKERRNANITRDDQ